ncbi:SLAM family member 9-like [Astyanax mexicanus]|uniref:SLAM family member 9-like n=1 Tax=Astyanax mexicanus TaxID=7994 RepID=UPI0020CB673C|nr:SLAM family member 9-like [Astyanax mexicanus]
MMARVTQLISLLCVFIVITGSSDVSVQVGDSVQLDVQIKEQTFSSFIWKHNNNNVLRYISKGKIIKHDPYKDRVEFNEETYSLTLKNLQKTDSGLYEAITRSQTETTVAQYNLTVWDPVEPPVLTLYKSADSCNITLTCRGHDLWINTTCYNTTCEEKNVTSPGGVALFLSIKDSLIICNLSNPVSWKQEKITLQSCDSGENPPGDPQKEWNWLLYVLIGVVGVLLILIVLGIAYFCKKKMKGNASAECENTIYQDVGCVQERPAATRTLEGPSTVYSTVQPMSRQDTELRQPKSPVSSVPSNTYESVPDQMQPETIYAQVQKRQH